MRHVEGASRHQVNLLPDTLEDYVDGNHPVRVIDAFVDSLDLVALGFDKAQAKETGRKPYHPGDLLKLYLYGYTNQVRSSRRLERECHRNLELLWLMKRLFPDFKTIADFRKNNGEALRGACRHFVQFCRQQSLLTGELVAIDGSKFRAAASNSKAVTRKQLREQQRRIEKQVDRYISQLDEADRENDTPELDRRHVEEALERLRIEGSDLEELNSQMDKSGSEHYCSTEPEARLMRGRGESGPSYNVQTSVDAQTGLIVHHEVTQDRNDLNQLQPMAEASKAVLERETLEVLADAGYSNGEQLAACEDQGITATVPSHRAVNNRGEFYQREAFHYDADRNSYWCPAGQELTYKTKSSKDRLYLYTREGCTECPLQSRCTRSKQRWVSRHFFEEAYARSDERLAANPELMAKRMEVAERPFAAIKSGLGLRRFRCWGKKGAESEMALGVLSYNLNRMTNRLGVDRMLESLQ